MSSNAFFFRVYFVVKTGQAVSDEFVVAFGDD